MDGLILLNQSKLYFSVSSKCSHIGNILYDLAFDHLKLWLRLLYLTE